MPEVLAEIRDRPTRRRLAALPCQLHLRRPRPDLLRLGESRNGLTGALRFGEAQLARLPAAWPGPTAPFPFPPFPFYLPPAVTDFSKKTGDYPSLSAADLQVLALTCQLQAETDGLGCLRWEPQDKVGPTPGMGFPPQSAPLTPQCCLPRCGSAPPRGTPRRPCISPASTCLPR